MEPLRAKYPLVIFANAIGDHILALPALRALEHIFPERLGFVGYHLASTFFGEHKFRIFFKGGMRQKRTGQWTFDAEKLANAVGPCDLLLSLNPWHSEAMDRLLEILSPDMSIGFAPSYSVALQKKTGKHAATAAFEVPQKLVPKLSIADFTAPYAPPSRSVQLAEKVRGKIHSHASLLVVHADTRRNKLWHWQRWRWVIDSFLYQQPHFIVLIVGSKRPNLSRFECGDRVISCVGLPLEVSLALVSMSDHFVGIDSCMLHMADFARIPSICLFGPTDCKGASLAWQ